MRTPTLQPEDLGVLAELLLRDPRLPSTMEAIRADLQARGWKMGKDRYNAIAARLTKAGHLARLSVYDDTTQRPTWVTRVYRNPANNEQYVDLGIAASAQVSTEMRETRDPADAPDSEQQETRVSPGQSRTAENPRSGAGSRKTRDLKTRVSPGQRRNAENPRSAPHPPHPPGEEDSSSPTPPTRTTGSLPSQREEAEFSLEELSAAREFLQRMERWQAGAATARRVAPKLLATMREQGWPSLVGMTAQDRALLEADLLRNTGGAKSWVKCLPGWVQDLRRYALVRPQPAPAPGGSPRPAATRAVIAACPACDEYGWLLDDDDSGPQRRCPHPGITRSQVEAAQ
ncbi:hypothetical protein DIZ27_37760 [Streptomyces sp. NWU339]|uniref:hypothetical protein n=1 Tax=Streptomyces sp. NWU339 TaxID=2185284 RepID=UPI000D6785D8|nr:hypothetical protein [Streptomyces sp. NWU339]PWI05681.1 hypothetical protein DIZ27_37760 [Streptomyces sp. NWU339]